jgi:amidase
VRRVLRSQLIGLDSFELPAAITVEAGESVVVETRRGTEAPFLTGPIAVAGARSGDSLAITIDRIETVGLGAIGFASTTLPWEPWGGVLRESALQPIFREVEVADGLVRLAPDTEIPARLMVGWIGLILPAYEADPWDHGGNLDTTGLTTGATLYLHDQGGAGRFLLGDLHAAMGEGEVSGMGVEIAGEVGITVDLVRGARPHRPVIADSTTVSHLCSRFVERDAYAQCIADAAAHLAHSQMISFEEANAWLGAVGHLRVSTVVSHSPTYRMDVPRSLLADPAELLRAVDRPALPYTPRPTG